MMEFSGDTHSINDNHGGSSVMPTAYNAKGSFDKDKVLVRPLALAIVLPVLQSL